MGRERNLELEAPRGLMEAGKKFYVTGRLGHWSMQCCEVKRA